MPNWLIKAAIQRTIGLMPFRSSVNYLFQKYVTHSVEPTPEWAEGKIRQAAVHVEHVATFAASRTLETCLEIGTGWQPFTPVSLFLCGAAEIRTVDITPLIRLDQLKATIRLFTGFAESGALARLLPAALTERVDDLRRLETEMDRMDIDAILKRINTVWLVADARTLPVPSGSVDLIVSNNTFEHVDARVLGPMLTELRRVVSTGGIMSHYIDLSDHYSHFDPSISNWNFLRYSDAVWRLLNNPIVPQNRLRISDYRRIHREAGFRIVHEQHEHVRTALPDGLQLAPRFREYDPADLLVTHSWVVSVPDTTGEESTLS